MFAIEHQRRSVMRLLLTWQANDEEIGRFQSALPGVEVVAQPRTRSLSRFDATLDSIRPHLADADVVAGLVLPPGSLDHAANLKLLAWMHAGCDELELQRLKTMGVQVTNLRGCNSIAVSEHAMALILGLAKRLPMKHKAVAEGRASGLYDSSVSAEDATGLYVPGVQSAMLNGRTLGIIGVGGIGSRVARHAKAFDMRVLGVRRHPDRGANGADEIFGVEELHAVLGQSDYVLISVPITHDTDGFFGVDEVAAMKDGAFLINIARGNLTEEFAVYDGLTSGKLGGYGSDVWWTYENSFPATYHFPVPSRTGIHRLPNVMGTGDQGGNAEDVLANNIERTIESIAEFRDGKELSWGIDLDLGY
jgi:phosphoglycerate dehydrogenase-like enzyme